MYTPVCVCARVVRVCMCMHVCMHVGVHVLRRYDSPYAYGLLISGGRGLINESHEQRITTMTTALTDKSTEKLGPHEGKNQRGLGGQLWERAFVSVG